MPIVAVTGDDHERVALLRQRRAREEFGLDPDDASARGADTVEHYEQ